ncbi:MAG: hypothetical protein OEZ21_03615 [Candidatus Bathyarchaeota archaeon]|nr:hypothetical protein [Candidatus Bathyarchaeota archaeon]MDH5746028.1 hypothetical protein [Candidatus Bathyarchaeota archaeon]
MKVMLREIMSFLPGKMAEGMKLLDEMITLANKKYGPIPNMKKYTPWLGGGNAMHTVVIEMEWDSFAQMAEFFEKSYADPEMMQTMPQWEAIEERHQEELYMVMP